MTELISISKAEILKNLTEQQLGQLEPVAREFGFRRGEYLFRLGESSEHLFIVRSGKVELTMPLSILGSEQDVVVEEVSEGHTLAWSALVEPHKLTLSGRAADEVKAVGFKRDELMQVARDDTTIGFHIMANLAHVVGHRLQIAHVMWVRELQRSVGEKYK